MPVFPTKYMKNMIRAENQIPARIMPQPERPFHEKGNQISYTLYTLYNINPPARMSRADYKYSCPT